MIRETITVLSLLGLGGVVGAFFNSIWERNKTIALQKQQNMILYASDDVLLKSHTFLNKPSSENYKKLAIAMRKDLWGGKIGREIEMLKFEDIIADKRP